MKVVALGFNHDNACVIQSTNQPRYSKKGGGLHAEEVIFREAKRLGIVRILICRVNESSQFLPIDPCPRCSKIAQKMNIVIDTIKPKED